ncbi:hypothetical protein L249_6766 [Ophiocordyceps polyrhachis-furcata BCC 54312]|uniref:PH domain-containing protein n=1 Tax=Ophiocordyceps polyrhachis-furcata BCC 54312 TaxID=1330021 RepID=A0A367LKI8_9HYPO|nr:hypothetical protein L249_6766 [Ophiocordyceps polyrhachis-furcata BCC 54312]
MSQFSAGPRTPSPPSSPTNEPSGFRLRKKAQSVSGAYPLDSVRRPLTPPPNPDYGSSLNGSPSNSPSPNQRQRSSSRPLSIVQTYQPPLMDINEDTIPELQPVFAFLNSHSNKLYQEGYFLKLDDQNTQGKPNPDRTWTECFAQLVGTVLSLWDAAELDAAGEDGEVLPKFINLTDASIKMIESLPTRSSDEQPLQNILSISTAGRNRYLLHFNSHHSLIQWTAGIRLAMYEHSTLQEAYTGALVAGKGKTLNNINVIMERSRLKTEEWVRVRFGAGVPWRRCWCVITPPDEKEYAKLQKELKKRSPYDRSPVPVLKGDIKFYDTRKDGKKQKKVMPIATITDAYSAYAIYPQAKSLIDASTLLKIEGTVSVHTDPPSSTEGFIFIMPETHPAVSGFEMLLRFLFPTWDTFGLYGRPGRLVASVLDPRSLMFAMPKHKRYGYLEILDVSTLVLEESSSSWNEKDWRKRLKDATGSRMNAIEDGTRSHSRSASRSSARLSGGGAVVGPLGGKPKVGFSDHNVRSSRSFSLNGATRADATRADQREQSPMHMAGASAHQYMETSDIGPESSFYHSADEDAFRGRQPPGASGGRASSDEDRDESLTPEVREFEAMRHMQTPEPVSRPPAFNHGPLARPTSKAYHSPELRRANSRLSSTTLDQMAKAGGMPIAGDMRPTASDEGRLVAGPSVYPHANPPRIFANDDASREAMRPPKHDRPPGNLAPPNHGPGLRSRSPMDRPYTPNQHMNEADYPRRPHTSDGRRPPHPSGPPRPPNSAQSHGRPDQGRPLPPPGSGGPPPPHHNRGRPPQRPPPGNYPPHHEQYGNMGPGSGPGPGPRPHPGPEGRGGPPPNVHPQRKPLPLKAHQSLTPNDIIDHYVSDAQRGGPPHDRRHPPVPPPHHNPAIGAPDAHRGGFRPTASPMTPNNGYGSWENPRPGAPRPPGGGGGSGTPPMPRTPDLVPSDAHGRGASPTPRGLHAPEQGGHLTGRQSPRSPLNYGGPEVDDRNARSPARHPGGSPIALGSPQRLTPDSHSQQRGMIPASPQYSPGGNPRKGGSPSSGSRPASPPSSHYAMARTGGPIPPQHGGAMGGPPGSFSRPLRPGAQSPPDPRHGGAQDPRNLPQQFQGHAF